MRTEWECNGNIMGILFLELKYERQSDIWVCLDIGYTPRILFFLGGGNVVINPWMEWFVFRVYFSWGMVLM